MSTVPPNVHPPPTTDVQHAPAASGPTLDRSAFSKEIPLTALRVRPQQCGILQKRLRAHMVRRRKVRPIMPDPNNPEMRLILLSEDVSGAGAPNGATELERLAGLPSDVAKFVVDSGADVVPHTLKVDYTQFTAAQVLQTLLPDGVTAPSSFETVGHIAHLNLQDEQLPFKTLIGQVLLEKNAPRIRTVVNKVGTIETQFRTFPMEVLAGDDDTVVECLEGGARFRLDYRTVYWNSRLQMEHMRRADRIGGPLPSSGKRRNKAQQRAQSGKTAKRDKMRGGAGLRPRPLRLPASRPHGTRPPRGRSGPQRRPGSTRREKGLARPRGDPWWPTCSAALAPSPCRSLCAGASSTPTISTLRASSGFGRIAASTGSRTA